MARLLLAAGVSARWCLQANFMRDSLPAKVQLLQPQVKSALGHQESLAAGGFHPFQRASLPMSVMGGVGELDTSAQAIFELPIPTVST